MRRFELRGSGIAWASALLLFGFLGLSQTVQQVSDRDSAQTAGKLQTVLRELIHSRPEATVDPSSPLSRLFGFPVRSEIENLLVLKAPGDQVQVVIELAHPADSLQVTQQLVALGGEVELTHENWVQAVVPVQELERLAEIAEVQFVRLPVRPFLMQGTVRSEGLPIIGSSDWNQAGWTGQGVKVALLDPGGFRGYESLLGRELPPREQVVTQSFRSDGQLYDPDASRGGQVHGKATAEIVHDIAPDAELYLAMFSTDVEFRRAVDWLAEQKVDVVNSSIGFYSGCFLEGGGIFEPQFLKAHQNGIAWTTAAGNDGDIHWEGQWRDPDGNGLYNYTDTDEGNTIDVVLLDYQYPDGRRVATSIIDVLFSWDAACSGAPDNYELVVLREDESGQLKPLGPWDGAIGQLSDWYWRPGVPIKEVLASEDFEAGRVGQVVRYHLAIRKKESNAAASRFEVLINCPCQEIQYLVPEGSVGITEPSISSNVITVGAVHHSSRCSQALCPDGKLLVYSSQGPTKDGRVKPDLTAPSHVSTSSFGSWIGEGGGRNPGFTGTSAAAPHVAGAAALVMQAFPDYSPNEIQQFLEDRAEDAGEPGKDNRYGAGILTLGQPPSPLPAPPTITGLEPASGLQGSVLQATISGTNLTGVTAVTFSGEGVTAVLREGSIDTSLPITITLAVDAAPGARTFAVTTPAGVASNSEITFTVLQQAPPGELVALVFKQLEFVKSGNWERVLHEGCLVYTNASEETSVVRVTLLDDSVREFEVPAGNEVIVCGNVVHIDTRPRTPSG